MKNKKTISKLLAQEYLLPPLPSGTIPLYWLIGDIYAWAQFNFDSWLPHFGIAEEAGELAHAMLKYRQKIRGTVKELEEAKLDAIADCGVYLLHYCGINKVAFNANAFIPRHWPLEEEFLLGKLFQMAGHIIESHETGNCADHFCTMVWLILEEFRKIAFSDGITMMPTLTDLIFSVWKDVRTRNWRKFPKDGKTK